MGVSNIPGLFIEIAPNSNTFFENASKKDVCIRSTHSNQQILFGVTTTELRPATIGITNDKVFVTGQLAVGSDGSGENVEILDVQNGNAYFDSNVYVMNDLGIGTTTPSEKLDLQDGNAKFGSNIYVLNSVSIGGSSNVSESLVTDGNIKVANHAYIMTGVGIGTSNNIVEALTLQGNAHISSNAYIINKLGIGTSNNLVEALTLQGNAFVSSNAYIRNRVAIGGSLTPYETLDVSSNLIVRSNAYVMRSVSIGGSNPTESLDVYSNLKVRGSTYLLSNVGIGTTLPSERLDVYGNVRITSNLYTLCNVVIGAGTTVSEKLDVTGNAKISSNLYVMSRIGVGKSNPAEQIDVMSNIIARSNIYAMERMGIGTVLPNESFHTAANAKVNGSLYVMTNVGIGHSNPTEALDIIGNIKLNGATYMMSGVGIGTSNDIVEALTVQGNAHMSGNAYIMNKLGVGTSNNLFEAFTLQGNAYMSSNAYIIHRLAVGGSTTPFESLDVTSNLIVRSNAYIMRNLSIGTSNPTESFQTTINAKINSNLYVMRRIAIGHSNPTEALDIQGNIKLTGDMVIYGNITQNGAPIGTGGGGGSGGVPSQWASEFSNIFVGHNSNVGIRNITPSFPLDVSGDIRSTSNIYAETSIGIGTIAPAYPLDVVGDIRTTGSVYAMNSIGIGNSTPAYPLDIVGDVNLTGTLLKNGVPYISSSVWSTSSGTVISIGSNTPASTQSLQVMWSNNQIFTVTGLGDIGIGTSNPLTKLHVIGDTIIGGNIDISGVITKNGSPLSLGGGGIWSNDFSNIYIGQYSNLGIRKYNPMYPLDVNGDINLTGIIRQNGVPYVGSQWSNTGSNVFLFSSNVGIGTSNPSAKLHVIGNTIIEGDIDISGNLLRNGFPLAGGGTGGGWLSDNSNVFVGPNSNVGIGVSNPTTPLEVRGDTTITGNLIMNNRLILSSLEVTRKQGYNANVTTTTVKGFTNTSNGVIISIGSNTPAASQNLRVMWSNTQIFTVTGQGNVGIGTSNPISPIHVVGSAIVTGNTGIGTSNPTARLHVVGNTIIAGNIDITGNITQNGAPLQTGGGGGSSGGSGVSSQWSNNFSNVFLGANSNVGIGISNPKLPLDVNGDIRTTSNVYVMNRLGIGTSNPAYPLDVIGDINFTGTFRQNGIPYIGSQWSNNRSNVFLLSSNVGIGKSNPATPLDVNGTITASTFAGPTIISLNNLGLFGSNTANFGSNTAVFASNTAIFSSNLGFSATNTATFSSNTAIAASNTAIFSSNTAVFGSNTAVSASNTAIFGSNTSVAASNTAVSATATAVSGCNAAVFGSNLAVWTSNNILNKAGGSIAGSLDVTSNITATSNVYAMRRLGVATSNPIVPLHVIGDARIEGALNVNSIFNSIGTDVQVTDQFTVSNNGTGPAFKVHQMGAQPIADFFDDSNLALRIADGGWVGIGKSNPSCHLDVAGSIASSNCLIGSWFNQDLVMWNRNVGNLTVANRFLRVDQTGALSLNAASNAGISLGIQDVARLVLSSSGNVDIQSGDVTIKNGTNTANAGGALNFGIADAPNAASMANIKGILANYDLSGNTLAGGLIFNVRSNVTPGSTNAASFTEAMRITSRGFIGIGTTNPTSRLVVQGGDIYCSGEITAYSDRRAKKDIQTISEPLKKINHLTGCTFEFIAESNEPYQSSKVTSRSTGLIAQDVLEVLPEAVHCDPSGHYSVAYGNITGLLVESIKALKKQNEYLVTTVEQLQARLSSIESNIKPSMTQ